MLIKTYLGPTFLLQFLFKLKLLDSVVAFFPAKGLKTKIRMFEQKTVHHLRCFQRC